ncbi:MAG: YeeE/YedE thiosulfate transporter family protein [Candidatus Thiodiazotropha sp.]
MDYGTAGTALTAGILFGYVLEQAGFGSPNKLTAQFRLADWSVFKVMFTAILVAAAGILLLQVNNTFDARTFYIPHADLGAVAVGGALIGSGMALGGYCPGTSVVGIMTGRLDGLIFAFGMVAGIWFFSAVYDTAWLHAILDAGRIDARTLPDLLGISPWLILLAMSVAAVAGFLIGGRHERRTQAG